MISRIAVGRSKRGSSYCASASLSEATCRGFSEAIIKIGESVLPGYVSRLAVLAFIFLLSVAEAGCGRMPRIIVLNDPLTADEHVTLGVSYEMKGDIELASREYERALKKDPSSFHARFNLGNVRLAQKRYDEAKEMYIEALELRPGDPRPANNLAWAAIFSGVGLESALCRLESAMSDPSRRLPVFLDTLGVLLGEMSRISEAEEIFEEALARCFSEEPSCEEALLAEIHEHRKALAGRRALKSENP